jgi:hypothetical protein
MCGPNFARWSILTGVSAAALGVIVLSQLERIEGHRLGSMDLLEFAVTLGIPMTVLGLLAALAGGVIWACRARLVHVLYAAVSVGIVAFLLAEFVDVNVHGTTAIFGFVIFAGAVGCAGILLIAVVRFLSRLRHPN